ncbi:acyl-CoA thioesterase-1 [Pseudarthrobacter siccitolerans]|uniref:Acyl-CoA thioesterase-1 n=1 Tax=Pseudarthrobacter siccitolerans TaxID=861266 RepID=A0ABU0PJA1_9MICC|nr:acyl-CoA thioesterase-1 [Pseudarthrobacter siccitolerans]
MDGLSLRVRAGMAAGTAALLVVTAGCTSAGPGTQASAAPPVRIVVIGDSLSTGYGTSPNQAWPKLLQQAHLNGKRPVQVTNAAENGSGYLVAGEDGNTFSTEVEVAVGPDTDVVVFFGSDNDWGADPEELREAAASTFAAASSRAPQAVLVAVGPLSGSEEPDPVLAEVRDSTASAAQNMGVQFIDPIADQWLNGRADVLLGPDGEHPSASGQKFLRDKMKGILGAAVAG